MFIQYKPPPLTRKKSTNIEREDTIPPGASLVSRNTNFSGTYTRDDTSRIPLGKGDMTSFLNLTCLMPATMLVPMVQCVSVYSSLKHYLEPRIIAVTSVNLHTYFIHTTVVSNTRVLLLGTNNYSSYYIVLIYIHILYTLLILSYMYLVPSCSSWYEQKTTKRYINNLQTYCWRKLLT